MLYRTIYVFLAVAIFEALAHLEACPRQAENELVLWDYEVRRPRRLGSYQEAEAEYGPTKATITCISINPLSEDDDATARITEGGIGRNFLKLKFRSRYSRGFRYKVLVYGHSN